jgi:hypothetical protein
LTEEHLLVRLAYDGARGRTVEIEAVGERYAELAQRLSRRRSGQA